ncbi:hypothetical protein [Undibacterium sp. TS12]|uniref:tetratricopeptide repeat protein n=1 Tax=Undibacterium sp. TS12 TaxID=2908202 RepID=UPI001F4CE03D|nr:hypothetical protein [Undibacterium sp. TS12]MCH8620497.1 hypothetical protein [Undibacterium sp. TS12]
MISLQINSQSQFMNNSEQNDLLQKSRTKVEAGSCRAAYKILVPLIKAKCPEALYLYSTFSFLRKETDEDFEQRSVNLLTETANLGHPEALHRLGVKYDAEDFFVKDLVNASNLFKRAEKSGNSKAKALYGLDLFYGSNGVPQDKTLGIEFLRQAVDDNGDVTAYDLNTISLLVLGE